MKITTKLALEYLNKNKKRSIASITRNNTCNSTYNFCAYNSIELSSIYGKYHEK